MLMIWVDTARKTDIVDISHLSLAFNIVILFIARHN